MSCDGVYFYNQGRVKLSPYERANRETDLGTAGNAPPRGARESPDGTLGRCLLSSAVLQHADELQTNVLPLAAYSPDFMLVEPLWRWVREDVTHHTCYDRREALIAQLEQFQQEINATPYAVADRLWVKTHLDPEGEKLRIST